MAEPDALCDPIATTSLYAEEGSDRSTALTLEAAAAEYARLRPPTAADASAYRETAPFIVVQLRKRRGKVEVLLDGHLSEGEEETRGGETVHVHKIYWHNGLHEDADTGTHAISPLAVACAVEDGQRSLRKVTASVWQSFLGLEQALPWQLLSEASVSPHRVSDTRCRVAAMPYPLAYHPKPVVSIQDDRAARRHRNAKRLALWQNLMGELFKDAGEQANTVNARLSETNMIAAALLALTGYYIHQYTGDGGIMYALAAWRNQETWQIAGKGVTYLVTTLFQGTVAYLSAPKDKVLATVKFTLKELARTLEVIAAELCAQRAGTVPNVQSTYGENERRLWDWLSAGEAAKVPVTEDGKFSSDDLLAQHRLGTKLHIVLDVDDAYECKESRSRHELRCERDDAVFLSSATSGTLDDLRRVAKAIKSLSDCLEEPPGDDYTMLKRFWDFNVVNPAYAMSQIAALPFRGKSAKGSLSKKSIADYLPWASSQQVRDLALADRSDRSNAREALRQLKACFLDDGGNGTRLQRKIEAALLSKGRPLTNDAHLCTRLLPQRVGRANLVYLFRAGHRASTEHVESAEELGGVVREFSKYDDASQALQTAMNSGSAYLRRFVPQWEARAATRVALNCACRRVKGFDRVTGPAGAPLCSTLAIATPVDIHFAEAVSRLMERSLRRIRFVVKRAQQKCDPSVLEALGLKHTSEDLLACQVFGDLWADELVALHKSNDVRRPQMQMLEQASRRATARLRALGTLLLELFTVLPQAESGADDEDEIAPEVSDVAFRATLAGRDAALLIGKLLFTRDDFEVRSVMTPMVRRSAAAAVRAAAAFERSVPVRLPHEPLASLFGARSEGVAAFERAGQLMGDDVAARRAIVAAYASSRLISDEQHDEALALVRGDPYTPWREPPRQSVGALLAAMRHRMASLRMDYDPLDVVESISALNIDDLTDELAVAKSVRHDFYVPFGFGDARPAPTLPPCPAPMFGSVPVLGVHLRDAFESIARVLEATSPPTVVAEQELRVKLEPSLRCTPPRGGVIRETNSVHPNVVQAFPMSTDRQIKARFSASRSRSDKLRVQGNGDPNERSRDLADAHRCNRDSMEMAHEVSSLAWNAERVVQCVVAALASARGMNGLETIGIELEFPSHENYLESWYNQRPQETLDAARRTLEEKERALVQVKSVQVGMEVERGDLAAQLNASSEAPTTGQTLALADATDRKAMADAAYNRALQARNRARVDLDVATADLRAADESKERSQRLLLGSVGIGMAMLSALVSPANVRVELRAVSATPAGMTENGPNDASLRFARCEAVRLSEACLAISQTW